jgi:secondary thiamine-phosphate synthase enzyme
MQPVPKSHSEYLWFNAPRRKMLFHITPEVTRVVGESGIREGFALVAAMHITAAVWVNDNEGGLHEDIDEWLEKLAPFGPDYRHHRTGEDNGDAHLKALLLGRQVVVPITDSKLDFGPWEQIFYHEFDGRRKKRVLVKVFGY